MITKKDPQLENIRASLQSKIDYLSKQSTPLQQKMLPDPMMNAEMLSEPGRQNNLRRVVILPHCRMW